MLNRMKWNLNNKNNGITEYVFYSARQIPIGVVATGSGNGLARSIADYCKSSDEYTANPTLHSSLTVARGCVVPVNLVSRVTLT